MENIPEGELQVWCLAAASAHRKHELERNTVRYTVLPGRLEYQALAFHQFPWKGGILHG